MQTITFITNFGVVEEEAGGISALGLDPLAILAQAATFLLLFWIIKRFALEKIVNSLEQRRKTIDDGIRLGEEMEAERGKLQMKVDEALKKARIQADEIIAEAHSEAGEITQVAEDSALSRVDKLLVEARTRIEEDTQKARTTLEKDMLKLVAQATEVILSERIDSKKDEALLKRALDEVMK